MSTEKRTARCPHHRRASYLAHLIAWCVVGAAESYGRTLLAGPAPALADPDAPWYPRPVWWRSEAEDLDRIEAFANRRPPRRAPHRP